MKLFPVLQQWRYQLQKHPSQMIAVATVLTIGLFVPQAWMNWRTYQEFNRLRYQELRLQYLSDRITHLDEVLTMSALMNAATGDPKWEQRYRDYAPKLDVAIQESIKLVPDLYATDVAKQVDAANQKLVEMEQRSLFLVQKNQRSQAFQLLQSPAYSEQKQVYANGVAQRNRLLEQQLNQQEIEYQHTLFISFAGTIASITLLIPVWWIVLIVLKWYLQDQAIAEQALAENNQELTQALDKLREAQLSMHGERLASLSQMVAGVAHEINNPLGFIRGNVSYVHQTTQSLFDLVQAYQEQIPEPPLALQDQLEDLDLPFLQADLTKALQSMQSGSDRIQEIVIGLRTFSRLGESERKSVDLNSGLDSTILFLQHRLQSRFGKPEIRLVREYDALPKIEYCPGQLNQVFMHVLANAIDAVAEVENPCITVRSMQVSDRVQIAIADNGCGIASEILPKIFDPFFTTKPIGQGKGLGLSISYQIVTDAHRGKLWCVSEVGKGSEFVIELPKS